MKKIILSAAVAAMALSTSALAADKGISFDVTGQAVIYYETHSGNGDDGVAAPATTTDKGMLDQANSIANGGIQLNVGSDLGNNFTFGSQFTYLTSLGLENDLVANTRQGGSTTWNNTTNDLMLTKIFIAKKIANTTLKLGRQELPKSLSPLAFTEGWNVFKNTFEAILAVNTDLPKTTLVGAYVTGTTGIGNLANTTAISNNNSSSNYMVTAQTKLIPMTTLTASSYQLNNIDVNQLNVAGAVTDTVDATAYWVDAKISPKDAPLGLNLSLQAANISPDAISSGATASVLDDTNAFGAKIAGKAGALSFKAAYSSVDGSSTGAQLGMRNVGTGTKTALYTQMMYNQNAITLDSDTIVLGVAYDAGSIGKFAANYGMSDMGINGVSATTMNSAANAVDYNELDLVYKVKSGGVQYFAIAAIRDIDTGGTMNSTQAANTTGATEDTVIRFWARYNF